MTVEYKEQEKKTPCTFQFCQEGKNQQIRVITGDLTKAPETYDVVVCSAFKGNYEPVTNTLIGALLLNRNISVRELAKKPAIDMRGMGGWISSGLEGTIRRVACIELLGLSESFSPNNEMIAMLKSAFLTLRHLLETAVEQGTEIRKIAMPILGTGKQGIDPEYIAVPLLAQSVKMFKTIDTLDSIDFYSLNPEHAGKLAGMLRSMLSGRPGNGPTVFISYSSKQQERAHVLRDALVREGYAVWIAPEGIPAGSNYLCEIPCAISKAGAVVLMLTEDAMSSPWVQREVSSAIGAGKEMIPAQLKSFELSTEFKFLLDGVQILPVWDYDDEEQNSRILGRIREKLAM